MPRPVPGEFGCAGFRASLRSRREVRKAQVLLINLLLFFLITRYRDERVTVLLFSLCDLLKRTPVFCEKAVERFLSCF